MSGNNDMEKLRERLLESPDIARLIIYLSLPLFISGSLQSLYEIVDTFWLSRLGSAALGTPTVSWPYRGILMSVGFGLASSISALTGQYIGAGIYNKASKVVGMVLGLLMLIGLPGSIVFFLLRNHYLSLTIIPGDVSVLATAYIGVTLAGVVFQYLFLAFNFALGAAGDTRTPMKISVIATLTNFVLDPLLIFGLRLGVLGAALATLFSMMMSGFFALYSFITGRHGFKITVRDLYPEKELLSKIMRISLPVAGQRLLTTLGFLVMIRVVSGLGTPVIAAYSIGQVVLSIDHVIVFPLIRSVGIIVAQTLGAMRFQRTRRTVRTGVGLILLLISSYIILLVLMRDYFISVFTDDTYVHEVASRMLLIFGPSVLGFNLLMLASSVARTSGHTFFMSFLSAARLWLARIPVSWYLAYYLGMHDTGLWIGMALSNYITGLIAMVWLFSWRWLKPVIDR